MSKRLPVARHSNNLSEYMGVFSKFFECFIKLFINLLLINAMHFHNIIQRNTFKVFNLQTGFDRASMHWQIEKKKISIGILNEIKISYFTSLIK